MAEGAPPIERIIEELQSGSSNEDNFRLLFESCYPRLHRFFFSRGLSPDDRLDLIQETFFGICKGIGSFRSESRFETWLYRIAINTLRKMWRRESTRKRSAQEVSLNTEAAEPLQDGETQLVSGAPSPEDEALRKERLRHLREAIMRLPCQMRRCLLLRLGRDLTYREIGIIMGVSPGTVKTHLFEARHRLQAELGPNLGDSLSKLNEEGS